MSQRNPDSSGAKQKPGEAAECSRALDGITGKPNEISKSSGTIPQKFLHGGSVDDKFLAKAKFDGKEFRDGKTWNLGFPRGNFLPNLKVRLPKEWEPRDETGNPESRLTIAGRCPCCDNVIKREQKMIRWRLTISRTCCCWDIAIPREQNIIRWRLTKDHPMETDNHPQMMLLRHCHQLSFDEDWQKILRWEAESVLKDVLCFRFRLVVVVCYE